MNDPIYIDGDKIKINLDTIKTIKNYKLNSNFFQLIDIGSDGNCLYRSISYIILHNQNYYDNIRQLVYNYINNNKPEFYEFCIEENNEFIVQVDINRKVKKYTFNEYINLIKEDGFFGDYIELYL